MSAASSTPVRRSARAAVAGLALLLAPAAALAQNPPAPAPAALSLQEAVAQARRNNPDFLATENDRRTARASVRAARADFLPSASASSTLGYTAAGERRFGSVSLASNEPDYYSSSYSVGFDYGLSGAKLVQPRIARAQAQATEQRVRGAEANLVAQVAQQYLTVLQGQEEVAQAEREVARTEEHRTLAQARLDVGAGTPLDVRRAEVQKGQAEVALLQARNNVANATLQLGQLMGVPVQPGIRLTSEFALFQPKWDADALVAQATANNPDLRAARAQQGAARAGITAARSSYLPTVNASLGWNGSVYRAGDIDPLVAQGIQNAQGRLQGCEQGNALARLLNTPQQDCGRFAFTESGIRSQVREQNSGYPFSYNRQPMSASLSFSLPIFAGLSRQQRVEEARVGAQDAEYQVRAQENRLRVDVGTTLRNLETAYQTAQLQDQVVRTATEELRLARERFRFGAASSVEVTDAQTSLAQAEKARIDAVYDFHKSLAALEALVGQSLR